MTKTISIGLLSIFTLLLTACDSEHSVSMINTQGMAEVELIASAYQVEVVYTAEGENQQVATQNLSSKINKFETWVAEQKFSMKAGRANLTGVYHYPKNEPRQLVGYRAEQRFKITDLGFSQYQLLMSGAPSYSPEQINLLTVSVSEQEKIEAKADLIKQAFAQAQQKSVAMAEAASLCNVSVAKITEQPRGHVSAPMMKMHMASESVHQTQSKQVVSVKLDIQWHADPC